MSYVAPIAAHPPITRRWVFTPAVAAALLALTPAPRAGAQAPTPPVPTKTAPAPGPATPPGQAGFKGYADVPGAVQFVTGVSPDKQAITVIFRNLDAASAAPFPLVGTRTLVLELPITNTTNAPIHVTQDIRGFVSTSGRARVGLIVQSGGKPTLLDVSSRDESNPAEKDAPPPAIAQARQSAQSRSSSLPPPQARSSKPASFDFFRRIEADIAPGNSYVLTFGLLAERDAPGDVGTALVTIDSLDVAIVPAAPSASPRAR